MEEARPAAAHSRVILSQPSCNALLAWGLRQAAQDTVRQLTVRPADGRLHLDVMVHVEPGFLAWSGIKADAHLQVMVEKITVAGQVLTAQVELKGGLGLMQRLVNCVTGSGAEKLLNSILRQAGAPPGLRAPDAHHLELDLGAITLHGPSAGTPRPLVEVLCPRAVRIGTGAEALLELDFTLTD